ncbi:MAG: SIMPL domain-containing protein [Candidatus Kaiserbacteria bacterium]|nr:MAG: SIMPL domain-containing protein [Candidatus Kaiserbacteria bacterium]
MDERSTDKLIEATHWPRMAGAAALGMLALFLVVATVRELKEFRFIGSGVSASNTITVSGDGEVFAVPDMGTFSVTVRERAKEVASAQDTATEKINAIINYLKGAGVEEKDIKTADYSVYPQYEYETAVCRDGYCPPGRQILNGYEVSQTLTVKVRDTDLAGDLLTGVGSRGASEVSGLSFTTEDEDALQAQARQMAIDDAREKAEALAGQLGVRLVRIVGFSENGSYPIPYAYARGGLAMDAESTKASAPMLPTGENKIVSNVNVTYEIR